MSSSDIAISIRGLSKSYTIEHGGLKKPTFRDVIVDRVRHPFKRHPRETFWALRDVSFNVKRGDVVGIIGRNGAGKSTLLKVLSRITEPTSGRIELYGRVGSLLEVGTGFHPELTGRENIFLNGAILGMARSEIRRQFNAIVDFAEVEKFLDTPVKRYSSGMYVRLAFAVAAHLNPEILIVDEVLAVGDAEFQKKCLGKMGEVARGGRTVLFVSHNMDAVLSLCSLVHVMDAGQASEALTPERGVRRYLSVNSNQPVSERHRYQRLHRQPITRALTIFNDEGQPNLVATGRGVRFDIELGDFTDVNRLYCSLAITNRRTQRVVLFDSRYHANKTLYSSRGATVSCYVPSLPLVPDKYYVDVILSDPAGVLEKVEQAAEFEVVFADILGTGRVPSNSQGHVILKCEWKGSPDLQTIG